MAPVRFKLFTLLFSCALVLLVCEVVASRFFSPPTHPARAEHDDRLGWRPRENLESIRTVKDAAGVPYRCRYLTSRDGFREFGSPKTTRPKVLVIGDSFTQSIDVANDQTYFRLLADQLDFELFAFGQSGYGTLQELRVVETYIDEIRPRLVVLQVCDNDFIDNHVILEREASYNLGLRRPYMGVDREVRFGIPANPVIDLLTRSNFGAWVYHRSKRLVGTLNRTKNAEYRIASERDGFPAFRDAVVITGHLLENLKTVSNEASADLVVFGATSYQPQLDFFRHLCDYYDIPFTSAAAEALDKAAASGAVITTADKVHWNPHGHSIVAEALEPFVRSRLLPPSSPASEQSEPDLE